MRNKNCLRRFSDSLGSLLAHTLNVKAFAPLVAAETEPQIRQVLGSADRGLPQQDRAAFILLILGQSQQLAGLAPEMLGIVRDDSWPQQVRLVALEGFIRNRKGSPDLPENCRRCWRISGRAASRLPIEDLCGVLLGELYPGRRSASPGMGLPHRSCRPRRDRQLLAILEENAACKVVRQRYPGLA